jgi:hypothetical protein
VLRVDSDELERPTIGGFTPVRSIGCGRRRDAGRSP